MLIEMNLTTGTTISIPDSNSRVFSSDCAITVPSVAAESGNSFMQLAIILPNDFLKHIHDLHSAPIDLKTNWSTGSSVQFKIYAEKRGVSEGGMSLWYVCASNGFEIRLAESVLQKVADLNQCVEALAIKASGGTFVSKTKDKAILRSMETIKCLEKND